VEVRRLLVLEVSTPLLADGLVQWPESRRLIEQRIGPRALVIDERHLDELQAKLNELQIPVKKLHTTNDVTSGVTTP
jgi:hypothetical protein